MDESLHRLEAQLEKLLPRGLRDSGREGLEARIDQLAAEARTEQSRSVRRGWGWAAVAAAVVMAVLAVGVGRLGQDADGVSSSRPLALGPEAFQTVELVQHVEERFDGGYVVGNGEQVPQRYWGYDITEMEKVVDSETGLTVRISTQKEEGVLTQLTTF